MQREQLYHHCFYVEHIAEGDLFPVGGGMIGSTNMPYRVRADYKEFYPKFAAIAEKHKGVLQSDQWQQWFSKAAPDIDVDLLTTLQTFTSAFEGKRKLQGTNVQLRNDFYDLAPDNIVNLSEVFSRNVAVCAEDSLLAKKFLDANGIKSYLYSGELMQEFCPGDIHFSAAHTFLIIDYKGQEFVYDPTNPNQSNGRDVVALMRTSQSLLHGTEIRKDCLLAEAEDVITHRKMYYGVGDCGNVPESLVILGSDRKRPASLSRGSGIKSNLSLT